MGGKLVCWRCGASVKPEQRPITRLEQCRSCQADLHVCRLCRYYNTRLIGNCGHDHAHPQLERERANYCQYFKPVPGAYAPGEREADLLARRGLEALFTPPVSQERQTAPAQRSAGGRAPTELEMLFGDTPAED